MTFKPVDDIENQIVEKEKHVLVVKQNLDLLQGEQYQMKLKLFEISENVRKDKSILSRLNTEIEILNRAYWAQRNAK